MTIIPLATGENISNDCAIASRALRQSKKDNAPFVFSFYGIEVTADARKCNLSERRRRQWLKGR